MRDYWFLIESQFSPPQFEALNFLVKAAARSGLNLYLTGGAVRDLVSGHPVRDLDFAVEGNPRNILCHVKKTELAIIHFDKLRQCADVTFSNGVCVEIGMCRTELYKCPGGLPKVRSAAITDDLRRRDFSINSMAVSLNLNSRGLFLDPNNGVADLERKELRALYNQSFCDDPERIFRFYRFQARLQFFPGIRTTAWLERALEDQCHTKLNETKQGRELHEILRENDPILVIGTLIKNKILGFLDKSLERPRISRDEFRRVKRMVGEIHHSDAVLLNFYCLTHQLSDSQRRKLAQKILIGTRERKLGSGLEANAKKLAKALRSRRYKLPSKGYDLLSSTPRVLLYFNLIFSQDGALRTQIKNFLYKYPTIRAKLPRAEIVALGLTGLSDSKKILDQVFRQIIDRKVRTQPQISRLARELVEKTRKLKIIKRKIKTRKTR